MNEQQLKQQIEATLWLFEHGKVRSHEEKKDLLRRLCACVIDKSKPQRATRDLGVLATREYNRKYYHTVVKPRRQAEREAQRLEEQHAEN